MDPILVQLFQSQIEDQCSYVLAAATEAEAALRSGDVERFWFSVQNLLSAAANVSKALWGVNAKLEKAREPLRESLGISDDSPLYSRDLRNDFDHFDERLDTWDRESTSRVYMDKNIAPSGTNLVGGITLGKHDELRRYEPDTGIATFFGDAYDVVAIVRAAEELQPIAHEAWMDGFHSGNP